MAMSQITAIGKTLHLDPVPRSVGIHSSSPHVSHDSETPSAGAWLAAGVGDCSGKQNIVREKQLPGRRSEGPHVEEELEKWVWAAASCLPTVLRVTAAVTRETRGCRPTGTKDVEKIHLAKSVFEIPLFC